MSTTIADNDTAEVIRAALVVWLEKLRAEKYVYIEPPVHEDSPDEWFIEGTIDTVEIAYRLADALGCKPMSGDPGRDVLIENLEDTLNAYADDPDAHNVTDVVRDIIMQITDYLLKGV